MQKRVLHVHTKSRTKSQWTLKNDLCIQCFKIITKSSISLTWQLKGNGTLIPPTLDFLSFKKDFDFGGIRVQFELV